MLICLVRVVALGYNQICNKILSLNFCTFNNILGPYKQKEKFYLTKNLKDI